MCLLISNNLNYSSCAKFYLSNFDILDFFYISGNFFLKFAKLFCKPQLCKQTDVGIFKSLR